MIEKFVRLENHQKLKVAWLSNHEELVLKVFLSLVKKVIETGTLMPNRTSQKAISSPGQVLEYDLAEGHPAITTRKLYFKTGNGELCGFLRGFSSAESFRDYGCKVWDQNANENQAWLSNPYRKGLDDLGVIYGVQWRRWPAFKEIPSGNDKAIADAQNKGFEVIAHVTRNNQELTLLRKEIDQLRECLDLIMKDPTSRRILFHAWNPADLDAMALHPCHLLYQFHPNVVTKEISLSVYLRSNDLGLGNPLNTSEAACLLALVGRLTGYVPKKLTLFIGDAHIYQDQLEMLTEQMKREPKERPRLVISDRIPEYSRTGIYEPEWLDRVMPEDFKLEGYEHHPPLTAPMAV